MKPTIQKWVNALRSGKYKQAKEKLYDEVTDGYCCLGVYAAVVSKESKAYLASDGEGPDKVYDRFDNILGPDLKMELIKMNDKGKSFVEIANVIEEKMKEKI